MKASFVILSLSLVGWGGRGSLASIPVTATGYAYLKIQPGFQVIANQLKAANNKVAQLIPQPAEGTELYQISNGTFRTNRFSSGAWTNPNETLEPGEGAIIFNPSTNIFRTNFSGEVLQGTLVNPIPAGLSLKSSMLPQNGGVTTDLHLILSPFDNVYQWKTNRFEVYTFLPDGNWFPSEPTINAYEAFFIRANREAKWVRTFTVNQ